LGDAAKTGWKIGEILNISKRTADEHVRGICRKLGANNRTQAVALARVHPAQSVKCI